MFPWATGSPDAISSSVGGGGNDNSRTMVTHVRRSSHALSSLFYHLSVAATPLDPGLLGLGDLQMH